MILRGTPLEIGNEVGCFAENIEKAIASGRIEDLGQPKAENPLIKYPEGRIALLYGCQGEHCQQVVGRLIGTVCSFGVASVVDPAGNMLDDQFEFPDDYARAITDGSPDLGTQPLCANRRQ